MLEFRSWRQRRRDLAELRSLSSAVALWGDSYPAMVVLVAAAMIPDVQAVVAQIPTCGIELPGIEPNEERFSEMKAIFETGDVSGGPEHTIGPLPVVSLDQINAPSTLTPPQAYHWFQEYGGRHGTRWENRATRVIPPTSIPFRAYLAAPFLKSPVLMMVGRDDEMVHCNPDVQRAVFDQIGAPKEFYEIGAGHFGLISHPGPLFDEAAGRQIEFLRNRLVDCSFTTATLASKVS